MPIEFLGMGGTNDRSETQARSGPVAHRPGVTFPTHTGGSSPAAYLVGSAAATGGTGNSNALVGTPETVAQALLDYVDIGVDILSMRGYDILGDAIDVGRHVIPLVRDEVARRDRERAALTAPAGRAAAGSAPAGDATAGRAAVAPAAGPR